MHASLVVSALQGHRSEGRRLRVSLLAALFLHALPVLVAGTDARALQSIEALRDEILIQLEPAPQDPAGAERALREAAAREAAEREAAVREAAEREAAAREAARAAAEQEAAQQAGAGQGERGAGEQPYQNAAPPLPLPAPLPEPPELPDEPETRVSPAGADSEREDTAEPDAPGVGPVLTQDSSGAGDGLFAGNGTGTLHAQICFIPEGTQSLRQIRGCSPIFEQYLDRINIPPRPFSAGFPGFPDRSEFFAVNIRGSFRVAEAGNYRFRLKADDGAQLFIDDQLVVDNDGMHDAISRQGEVELSAGRHRVRVWYFQGIRYELALQLFVTPPGGSERIFTPQL
jgi:hypothetical protein